SGSRSSTSPPPSLPAGARRSWCARTGRARSPGPARPPRMTPASSGWGTRARAGARSRSTGSLLLRPHLAEPDGRDLEVLDLERVALAVEVQLRGRHQRALALAVGGQPDLRHQERVVGGARPVDELTEAHGPVGGDDDLAAAIGAHVLPREVDVPAEAGGRADVAGARQGLGRVEPGVGPLLGWGVL